MRKKLLCITPHLSTGGMPQVLYRRIESMINIYDVYLIEYSNISNYYIVQKNKIKKIIPNDNFFTLGDNKHEIIDIIEKINPDIIHFEEFPETFIDYKILYSIYNKDRKYKIFETTHSSEFDSDNKIFLPDKFIFVSHYNSFKFNKIGIPIEVVEYPIDKKERTKHDKTNHMNKLGFLHDYKHVLNVGLFTSGKNQGYAFEIARRLEKEKIIFHFIGNQAINFKKYWEPIIKNKPDNCVIWGERSDVTDFYIASDVFLFTSKVELNPLVVKESLENDLPIFMFRLDSYCNKYDNNKLVRYITGNVDVDAENIKNFLKVGKNEIKERLDGLEISHKENKIYFKFNENKSGKYKIKFKENNNVFYETEYDITSDYYSWSELPKLKELDKVNIELYDNINRYYYSLYLNDKLENKKIDVVINLKYKDYQILRYVVDSVRHIANNIIICYHNKDKLINNIEEEYGIIGELNEEEKINLYEIEYDDSFNQDFILRKNGFEKTVSEWVLFIESNEIINSLNGINLNEGIDAYIFDNKDKESPLLIKRDNVNIRSNRFDMISQLDYKVLKENNLFKKSTE